MKNSLQKSITTAMVLGGLSLSAHAENKIKAGSYNIDPAHSKVGFEIPHLVISTVEGRFTKFEGSLELAEKFEKSKVSPKKSRSMLST